MRIISYLQLSNHRLRESVNPFSDVDASVNVFVQYATTNHFHKYCCQKRKWIALDNEGGSMVPVVKMSHTVFFQSVDTRAAFLCVERFIP